MRLLGCGGSGVQAQDCRLAPAALRRPPPWLQAQTLPSKDQASQIHKSNPKRLTCARAHRTLPRQHVVQPVGGVLRGRRAVVAVKHGGVGAEYAVLQINVKIQRVRAWFSGGQATACRQGAGQAVQAAAKPVQAAGAAQLLADSVRVQTARHAAALRSTTALTCTACPVDVRGWKALITVCRSSMYGRMPLAWENQRTGCPRGRRMRGGSEGEPATRGACSGRRQRSADLRVHKWKCTLPRFPPAARRPASAGPSPPARSPTARGPAAGPAAPPASRAGSPHLQRPQTAPLAGLQHGKGSGLAL